MKALPSVAALGLVAALSGATLVGCGGDKGGSGTGAGDGTTTSKYACSINGDCKNCPSSEDLDKCAKGESNACTSTDSSYCK